jgi:hypothetical protein
VNGVWHSSVAALGAFLDVLQHHSHVAVVKLGNKAGPPVKHLKGDPFEKRK